MGYFIVGLFLGACIGIVIAGLLIGGKDSE